MNCGDQLYARPWSHSLLDTMSLEANFNTPVGWRSFLYDLVYGHLVAHEYVQPGKACLQRLAKWKKDIPSWIRSLLRPPAYEGAYCHTFLTVYFFSVPLSAYGALIRQIVIYWTITKSNVIFQSFVFENTHHGYSAVYIERKGLYFNYVIENPGGGV